jgi:hypothetical protein
MRHSGLGIGKLLSTLGKKLHTEWTFFSYQGLGESLLHCTASVGEDSSAELRRMLAPWQAELDGLFDLLICR